MFFYVISKIKSREQGETIYRIYLYLAIHPFVKDLIEDFIIIEIGYTEV